MDNEDDDEPQPPPPPVARQPSLVMTESVQREGVAWQQPTQSVRGGRPEDYSVRRWEQNYGTVGDGLYGFLEDNPNISAFFVGVTESAQRQVYAYFDALMRSAIEGSIAGRTFSKRLRQGGRVAYFRTHETLGTITSVNSSRKTQRQGYTFSRGYVSFGIAIRVKMAYSLHGAAYPRNLLSYIGVTRGPMPFSNLNCEVCDERIAFPTAAIYHLDNLATNTRRFMREPLIDFTKVLLLVLEENNCICFWSRCALMMYIVMERIDTSILSHARIDEPLEIRVWKNLYEDHEKFIAETGAQNLSMQKVYYTAITEIIGLYQLTSWTSKKSEGWVSKYDRLVKETVKKVPNEYKWADTDVGALRYIIRYTGGHGAQKRYRDGTETGPPPSVIQVMAASLTLRTRKTRGYIMNVTTNILPSKPTRAPEPVPAIRKYIHAAETRGFHDNSLEDIAMVVSFSRETEDIAEKRALMGTLNGRSVSTAEIIDFESRRGFVGFPFSAFNMSMDPPKTDMCLAEEAIEYRDAILPMIILVAKWVA